MGVAIGHSASIAGFSWSPAHISVSNFGLASGLYQNCGVLSFGSFVGTGCLVCTSIRFGWA